MRGINISSQIKEAARMSRMCTVDHRPRSSQTVLHGCWYTGMLLSLFSGLLLAPTRKCSIGPASID